MCLPMSIGGSILAKLQAPVRDLILETPRLCWILAWPQGSGGSPWGMPEQV